ncbi:proton-conducting transporter membrane subunit [Streptomyces albus]|nr:proton-conducting transporter membrane subunit [Streptomyces albus]
MSALLWLLLALPLTGGAALLLAGHRADRAAPTAGAALALATCALAAVVARTGPEAAAPFLPGLPVRLAVDGLSAPLAVTAAAVAALVLLAARAGLGPSGSAARFTGLMLLFSGAMLTTVTAATLPLLLMGWEVMGATSWALIGHTWRDRAATGAATTAFLTTRAGDLGLYVAAGAALRRRGRPLALDDLARTGEPWRSLTAAGIILAALGKSAQLPFSFWLSGAMRGPAPVSALLHSATMVAAGAYLLLRTGPLLAATGWGAELTAWTGAATALVLGLVAVAQRDLKQLLAASTCAQLGFMVLAAGVGATTGGTLQLLAHAAAKSLLFLLAGAWLTTHGTRLLPGLTSAARSPRSLGLLFTTGALCLAGFPRSRSGPPRTSSSPPPSPATPGSTPPASPPPPSPPSTAPKPSGTSGAPCPPRPHPRPPRTPRPAHPPRPGLRRPHPARPAAPAHRPGGHRRHRRPPRAPPLGGGPLRRARPRRRRVGLVGGRPPAAPARPLPGLARPGTRRPRPGRPARPGRRPPRPGFDTRVLERAVDAAAYGTLALARRTDRIAERGLSGAVAALAAAVRTAGSQARRPQTGQLHQYLAQAVAAFTALAVVFLLVR